MIGAVSFLAWVSEKDVERPYSEKRQSLLKTNVDDIEKEKWSKHSLHKFTKEELILKCVQKKLEPTGNKVDLVKRLSKVYPFEELEDNPKLYNGDLKSVPSTISGFNRLNVAHLREILRHHGILEDGAKEELVLRVGLLKGGAGKACFSKERISIIQAISFAEKLFSAVEALSTEKVCRVREYSRCNSSHYRTRDTPLLSVFQTQIKSLSQSSELMKRDFKSALRPLKQAVETDEEAARLALKPSNYQKKKTSTKEEKGQKKKENSVKLPDRKSVRLASAKDKEKDEFDKAKHFLTIVGSQVEVYWSEDELSGTNWESGWYRGEVQSYDEDEDIIYVMYEKEKTELYSIYLMSGLLEGIIRPVL